jgi:hypothetical protein
LLTIARLLNVENLLALALLLLMLAGLHCFFEYSYCFLVACSDSALLAPCGGHCLICNTSRTNCTALALMLVFLWPCELRRVLYGGP